jgi:hypothetical protein
MAQEGGRQERVVTAGADDPPLVRARDVEWSGVALDNPAEQFPGGSDLRVAPMRMRMIDAPAPEKDRVEEEPRHDIDNVAWVGGQRGEQLGELARIGRRGLGGVERSLGGCHGGGLHQGNPPGSLRASPEDFTACAERLGAERPALAPSAGRNALMPDR